MSNICDLTHKKSRTGNSVSHSNVKTFRMFHANLQKLSLFSKILNAPVDLKLATSTIKTVMRKYGDLDSFLLLCKNRNLTPKALGLKKLILGSAERKGIKIEAPIFVKKRKQPISKRLQKRIDLLKACAA